MKTTLGWSKGSHCFAANHRNIVRSPIVMREIWLEMWHDIHSETDKKFVTKGKPLFSKPPCKY